MEQKVDTVKLDMSKLKVRAITEKDTKELSVCDDLIADSFNAILKIDSFRRNGASANYYCEEIYIAEDENKTIVGCLFALHCGSIRQVGPICVLPKYWKNGVGSVLLSHLFDNTKNLDIYKNNVLKRDVLVTMAGSFHTKFYMRFGFKLRFLSYIMNLNPIGYQISKDLKDGKKSDLSFGALDAKAKNLDEICSAALALCEKEYGGFNPMNELKGILSAKNKIGEILYLYDNNNKSLLGYCACKYASVGDKKRGLWVRFGIACDLEALEIMMVRLIEYCQKNDFVNIELGIDCGRVHAFDLLRGKIGFGYGVMYPAIHMGRISNGDKIYDDCNTQYSCILGDYRG